MDVAQGSFNLQRVPKDSNPTLRAWDAADEYLLNHLVENNVDLSGRVLLANDSFGALAVALAPLSPTSWGDSLSGHQAMEANLAANALSGPTALRSDEDPTGPIDVALIKIPKHNGLLEDQLHRLRPLLSADSVVIAAGMVKNVHTSTLDLFQSIVGPTRTSLAKKKARLAFVELDGDKDPGPNPWPMTWTHDGLKVVNRGGVFSARKLDIGTRFLLENLPVVAGECHVVDLGCGNGVVGALVLKRNPDATCTFVDESYAAVASARQTVQANVPNQEATFVAANSLGEAVEPGTVDLIINNPPFHANTALSTGTAAEMFRASHTALGSGGELLVVANRHLGYHIRLKRKFGSCETIASNSKFVLHRATRS
jgi:23S rRNA (guanine1835-N2)-methyltransferase